MSDFEHDFDVDEAETEAAAEAAVESAQAEVETEEAVEETIEAEEEDEEDFFAESEVPAAAEVDPSRVITVRTSQAGSVYVETDVALPFVDVVTRSGLRFQGDYTGWVNGAEIALGTQIAPGTVVTVVGSVKGGAR